MNLPPSYTQSPHRRTFRVLPFLRNSSEQQEQQQLGVETADLEPFELSRDSVPHHLPVRKAWPRQSIGLCHVHTVYLQILAADMIVRCRGQHSRERFTSVRFSLKLSVHRCAQPQPPLSYCPTAALESTRRSWLGSLHAYSLRGPCLQQKFPTRTRRSLGVCLVSLLSVRLLVRFAAWSALPSFYETVMTPGPALRGSTRLLNAGSSFHAFAVCGAAAYCIEMRTLAYSCNPCIS